MVVRSSADVTREQMPSRALRRELAALHWPSASAWPDWLLRYWTRV